jgi:deoxycytidine triphosphate deaminase
LNDFLNNEVFCALNYFSETKMQNIAFLAAAIVDLRSKKERPVVAVFGRLVAVILHVGSFSLVRTCENISLPYGNKLEICFGLIFGCPMQIS